MRAGWNRRLRDLLWAADPKCQLIVEALVVEAEDVKDLRSDWNGADGSISPDFELLDRGGIKLAASSNAAAEFTTAPDLDITAFGPAAQMSAVFVRWHGGNAHRREIKNVVAKLDPRVDNGQPRNVARWVCKLYRLRGVGPDEGRIELDLIGEQFAVESGDAIHDVTFSFVRDGLAPEVGGPPERFTDQIGQASAPQPEGYPTTAIVIFAYQEDGTVATNVSWRGKSGAAATSGTDLSGETWSAEHSTLEEVGDGFGGTEWNAGTGGAFAELGAIGFPYFQLNRQGYASAGVVTFVTNKANLGSVPTVRVQVIAQGEEPGDSELGWEISDDAGANWFPCADGDFVAESNTESGHDLTAVGLQQQYSLRVTLNASSDLLNSPVARRFGVQELTLTDLAGAAVVQGCSWGVDPVHLKGEIGQPEIAVLKTGERDYRDYFTQIFSTAHIGQVQMRLWVGHPELERRYWLHLDTFDVEDLKPGDSQGTVICLSVLGRLRSLGKIPLFDEGPGTRTAVFIQDAISDVYDELLDTHIGIEGRLHGPGIPTSFSDTISKTLTESDAKDELDAVAYLAGHAVISSQGRIKAVQMMETEGQERPVVAWFPREEVKPIHLGPGFTNRIDEFFVPHGWDEGLEEFSGESRGVWTVGFDAKLRARGVESQANLDDEIARWIEGETLGDRVALRAVKHFATGLMLWEIEATYAHPHLEPGDVVIVQTDQFVARDPITDRQICGVVSAKATIAEVRDPWGRHLVAWVKGFADIIVSEELIQRVGYVRPEFLSTEAIFGTDGSLVLRGFINIPGGSVRAVDHGAAFQSEATTRAASATAATDGSFQITLASAGTYDLAEDAYITAFAYETAAGSGAESRPMLHIKATNANDADTLAEITGLAIGFHESGYVRATAVLDDDAAGGEVFWTVGIGSAPADPDDVTYDGTNVPIGNRSVTGNFDGGGGFATRQALVGEIVYVKVVATNSDGELGPVVEGSRRRGDTERIPPIVAIFATKGGDTCIIQITVSDPSLAVTAIERNERVGTEGTGLGGWNTWTTAGGGSGTVGSDRTLIRVRDVLCEAGVDGEFMGRVEFNDENGDPQVKEFTVNLANLQSGIGDFEISGAELVPIQDSSNWLFSTGDGSMGNELAASAELVGAVQIPKGVDLDAISAELYCDNAAGGDEVVIQFIHLDTSRTVNVISTLTHDSDGFATETDSSPGHTTEDGAYYIRVDFNGCTGVFTCRFYRFRVQFDRPSYKRVI